MSLKRGHPIPGNNQHERDSQETIRGRIEPWSTSRAATSAKAPAGRRCPSRNVSKVRLSRPARHARRLYKRAARSIGTVRVIWQELCASAHHEAGHAVAYRYGRPVRQIEIDGEGSGLTRCLGLKADARRMFRRRVWQTLVQQEICICLAGPLAEEIAHGRNTESAKIDLQHARRWLGELMVPDDSILTTFATQTRELLIEPETWNAVRTVARRLIQGRKITGPQVDTICHALRVPRGSRFV